MVKNGVRVKSNHSVTFESIIPAQVCAQCGKEFVLPIGSNFADYAYKEYHKSGMVYCCSWSCLQARRRGGSKTRSIMPRPDGRRDYKWETKRQAAAVAAKVRQLKIILPYHRQGISGAGISRITGFAAATISRRLQDYARGEIGYEE